ncbi:MAG: glycosyltransferase, partial [Saprospiraceae bacterium]
MRILVVAPSFWPLESPRAHRWTAIAEHWASIGHEVQVVTLRQPDSPRFEAKNGVQIHRTGRDWAAFFRKKRQLHSPAPTRPIGWQAQLFGLLHRSLWKNLAFPDGDCLAYFPLRQKVFQLLENQSFDALVSVSWPFTAHLVGLAAKRKFPEIIWLADSGDPFSGMPENRFRQFFWGKTASRLEQKVFETADAATVTTAATARFFEQKMGTAVAKKLVVVPPLLHPSPPRPPEGREPSDTPT